jgi:hypothetical protein
MLMLDLSLLRAPGQYRMTIPFEKAVGNRNPPFAGLRCEQESRTANRNFCCITGDAGRGAPFSDGYLKGQWRHDYRSVTFFVLYKID